MISSKQNFNSKIEDKQLNLCSFSSATIDILRSENCYKTCDELISAILPDGQRRD